MTKEELITELQLHNSKCLKYLDNDFVYHMQMLTLDVPYKILMGNVQVYFTTELGVNNDDHIVIESGDCNYYAKFASDIGFDDLLVQIIDILDNLIDRNEEYFN